jgi:hypothetical protein
MDSGTFSDFVEREETSDYPSIGHDRQRALQTRDSEGSAIPVDELDTQLARGD